MRDKVIVVVVVGYVGIETWIRVAVGYEKSMRSTSIVWVFLYERFFERQ